MLRLILLALHVNGALCVLIAGPKNTAVLAGEKMSMDCRTDEEYTVRRWEVYNTTQTWNVVYSHERATNFADRFAHFGAEVNSNGSGFIYTNSVKTDDAGLYKCFVRGVEMDVEASAQLIVFESAPICETIFTTTDNDSLSVSRHLLMRCSITFRGFWTPTLEWRRHDGNGNNSRVWKKITDATVEVSRFTNNTITSTLAVRINESEKYSHFSCQISFANYDGNDKSVTATNVPDFFYFWNSDVAPRLGAEVCSTTSSALYFNFITVSCLVLLFLAAAVYLKCKRPASVQSPAAEEETENQMAAKSHEYCALETRPYIAQDSTAYCELIL